MSDKAAKLATLYAGFKGQFPNVNAITAKELHDELLSPNRQGITLIDVRTPQEWEVSRLPGNVLSRDAFDTVRGKTPKSAPLVTYWYRAADAPSPCMQVLFSCGSGAHAPNRADHCIMRSATFLAHRLCAV